MSPTTSSVAQNLFYAQNQFVDITYIQNLSTFFKYYNILKREKDMTLATTSVTSVAKKMKLII
jgi:hypothetical protein